MADHFASEIFQFAVITALIGFLLLNFTGSTIESGYEMVEINEEGDFDQSWSTIGNDFNSLENLIPGELFTVIIVPIILVGIYIGIKTVSGVLPNWISGG